MLTRQSTLFSKIEVSDGKWTIGYLDTANSPVQHEVSSRLNPKITLHKAMREIREAVIHQMNFEPLRPQIEVVGAYFTEDKENITHVQVKANMVVQDMVWTFKTPKIPYSETKVTKAHFTDDEVEMFETLQDEALDYINGELEQRELF